MKAQNQKKNLQNRPLSDIPLCEYGVLIEDGKLLSHSSTIPEFHSFKKGLNYGECLKKYYKSVMEAWILCE